MADRVQVLNDPALNAKFEIASKKFYEIFPKSLVKVDPVVIPPGTPFNRINIDSLKGMGAQATFSKKTMDRWEALLASVKDEKTVALLLKNAQRLEEFGLFTLWLNRLMEDGSDAIQSMEKVLQENQPLLEWLEGIQNKLPCAAMIARFAEPEFAKENLNDIIKLFAISKIFIQKFDAAPSTGKMAMVEFFQKAVHAYEGIIQQVAGSDQFADRRLQASIFQQLIDRHNDLMHHGCFKMMEKQDLLVDPEKEPKPPLYEPALKDWGRNHRPQSFSMYSFVCILKKGGNGREDNPQGIDGLGKRIPHMKIEELAHLFEVRPEFFVESTLILKPFHHDYLTRWPETLQETFLTIQGNIQTALGALRSDLGIDEKVLDETATEVNDFWKTPGSGVDQNYVTKEKESVSVFYTTRYYKYGGSIQLTYHPLHPEKGLEFIVQTIGGNKHNFLHWTALYGSWLESIQGIDGSMNIDWAVDPQLLSQASFTMRLQPNDPQLKSILRITGFMIDMIRNSDTYKINFVSAAENCISRIDGFTLKELQPQFFGKCFYGTKELLDLLADDEEWEKLAEGLKCFVVGYLQVKPAHWNEAQALEQIADAVKALKEKVPALWERTRLEMAQDEAVKASSFFSHW